MYEEELDLVQEESKQDCEIKKDRVSFTTHVLYIDE